MRNQLEDAAVYLSKSILREPSGLSHSIHLQDSSLRLSPDHDSPQQRSYARYSPLLNTRHPPHTHLQTKSFSYDDESPLVSVTTLIRGAQDDGTQNLTLPSVKGNEVVGFVPEVEQNMLRFAISMYIRLPRI